MDGREVSITVAEQVREKLSPAMIVLLVLGEALMVTLWVPKFTVRANKHKSVARGLVD